MLEDTSLTSSMGEMLEDMSLASLMGEMLEDMNLVFTGKMLDLI